MDHDSAAEHCCQPQPSPVTVGEVPPATRLPTLAQALALYGTILGLAVFPGSLIVLSRLGTHLVGPVLTQLLLILLPLLLWGRAFRWNMRLTLRLKRVPWPVYLYTVVASFSFIPVAQEMEMAVEKVMPVPDFIEEIFELLILAPTTLDLLLVVIAVAVVPGLVEELLFRGIVLWALLRRVSPPWAVICCALLFAVMHLNPWQFVGGLVLGSIYGTVVLWTGSIWPVVLAHTLNNAAFIALANFGDLDALPLPLSQRVLISVLGLAAFAYSLGRLRSHASLA
jgi:membrane protease YdiL (CAAX protease family)